jgi:hypothetical protein
MAASTSMRALVLERHNGPFVLRPALFNQACRVLHRRRRRMYFRKKQEMLGVRFQ